MINKGVHRINRVVLCLLISLQPSYASVIIPGDKQTEKQRTFSWPLRTWVANASGSAIYGAIRKSGIGHWTLARCSAYDTSFIPFAPEKVLYNNVADQLNPLHGKEVALLSVISNRDDMRNEIDFPLAVLADEPANAYIMDRCINPAAMHVLGVKDLRDANGQITQGIVALTGSSAGRVGAFAAVKPHEGNFGDPGTGIALLSYFTRKEEDKEKKTSAVLSYFSQLATNAEWLDVRAIPMDRTIDAVKIGSDLAAMGNVVSLHWDPILMRLFVALQVTAGNGPHDGARALLVGRGYYIKVDDVEQTKFIWEPIAPDDAFVSDDAIVGTRGAGKQVSLHHVTTLHTTTAMTYVVVVGGNGAPQDTASQVYALPLVDGTYEEDKTAQIPRYGTLAHKHTHPTHVVPNGVLSFAVRRFFTEPVTHDDDLYTCHDREVRVGGGPLDAGPITNIIPMQDALFAVVAGQGQQAGVYHSQALFDASGAIKSWTAWRRVYATPDTLFDAVYNRNSGSLYAITSSAQEPDTVRATAWGGGMHDRLEPLVTMLRTAYPASNGGIRTLYEASSDIQGGTPGFVNESVLVAAGKGKLTVVETACRDEHGVLCPHYGSRATDVVEHFAGGALQMLGAIDTVTSVATDNQAWLWAGGVNGLCVLAQPTGAGWNPHQGIGSRLCGLAGMQWFPVGNYRFVRKLIHDGNFLYVLTFDRLDRIDVNTSLFGPHGHVVATTIARREECGGAGFNDCLVSDKCALLATTVGLYRTGNGCDARTAHTSSDMHWTHMPVPGSQDPIIKLLPITTTHHSYDVARYGGGNVYVLSSYQGYKRSSLARCIIGDVTQCAMADDTVQWFHDEFLQGQQQSFRRCAGFVTNFVTDGASFMYMRPQGANTSLYAIQDRHPERDLALPIIFPGERLPWMQRLVAHGSWIIAGDTVVVNE